MKSRIVVWHATKPYAVGSVFEQDRHAELVEKQGAIATLPVDERLLQHGPVGGYFRRDWGLPGLVWEKMIPTKAAPMLLWVAPDLPYLHYIAMVKVDTEQGKRPRGSLRLSPGPTPTGAFTGGIAAVDGREIVFDEITQGMTIDEVLDGSGAWILRSRARVSVQIDGYLSCCLSGTAEGVRILWSAVSQSSQEG